MDTLKRQLTLKDGIALALGSVLGSGILFLPSLTFSISGAYTLWVWIITTLLCIPLVYIFSDMVKEFPNESGVEGFISSGLGHRIGASIPIIFLGTVCLGLEY
jgi:amino acid efflux transporter